MPINVNSDGLTVIDFESDLSFAHIKTADKKAVWFAFDTDWKTEKRDFDPKALIYFTCANDIDILIESLKNARKKFTKRPKHYAETGNVPSAK